jgi:hypothetical protein
MRIRALLLLLVISLVTALGGSACSTAAPEQPATDSYVASTAAAIAMRLSHAEPALYTLLAPNVNGFARTQHGAIEFGPTGEPDTQRSPANAVHGAALDTAATRLPLTATAPANGAQSFAVRLESYANYTLQLQLNGARATNAIVDHGRAIYPNVFPGVHRVIGCSAQAIEDAYLITDQADTTAGTYQLRYAVGLPPGITQVRVLPDRAVVFEDAGGTARLAMATPFAIDATGAKFPVDVTWDANRKELTLALTAHDIALPALVDPQFVNFLYRNITRRDGPSEVTGIEFDSTTNQYRAFAGNSLGVRAEAYHFDNGAWQRLNDTGQRPSVPVSDARASTKSSRMVVLGEQLDQTASPNLWELNGTTWTKLPDPTELSSAIRPSIDFAPISDNVRIIGVSRANPDFLQIWELQGNAWTKVGPMLSSRLNPDMQLLHETVSGHPLVWVRGRDVNSPDEPAPMRELRADTWVDRPEFTPTVVTTNAQLRVAPWSGEVWILSQTFLRQFFAVFRNGGWQQIQAPTARCRLLLNPRRASASLVHVTNGVTTILDADTTGVSSAFPTYPYPPPSASGLLLASLEPSGPWIGYTAEDNNTRQPGTWSFDGMQWTPLVNRPVPRVRDGMMAYDAATKKAMLVGRPLVDPPQPITSLSFEIWDHDGKAWSQRGTTTWPFAEQPLLSASKPGGGMYLVSQLQDGSPKFYGVLELIGTKISKVGQIELADLRIKPIAIWARPTRLSILQTDGTFVDIVNGIAVASGEYPELGDPLLDSAQLFNHAAGLYAYGTVDFGELRRLDDVGKPKWSDASRVGLEFGDGAYRMFSAPLAFSPDRILYVPALAQTLQLVELGAGCESRKPCTGGSCVDGVCCLSPSCSDTCSSCATGTGNCATVRNQPDPDTCDGKQNLSCNNRGECGYALARECTDDDQCASGYCADGVCCNERCLDTCHECKNNIEGKPGLCLTANPLRDPTCELGCISGVTDCGGYACDENTGSCRSQCATDRECTGGFVCRSQLCDPPRVTSERCSVAQAPANPAPSDFALIGATGILAVALVRRRLRQRTTRLVRVKQLR